MQYIYILLNHRDDYDHDHRGHYHRCLQRDRRTKLLHCLKYYPLKWIDPEALAHPFGS